MIGAAAAMHRAEHTRLEYFQQRLGPRGQRLLTALTNGVGMLLFLSLIRTSLVLVPNAQLQSSAGPRPAARLRVRGDPGRLHPHPPAHGVEPRDRAPSPMAETLLIVFVIFVVLGMPISIALGRGRPRRRLALSRR